MKHSIIPLIAALLALAASCTESTESTDNAATADALPPIFPDYTEVTVPVGIAPLNFGVPDAALVDATLAAPDGTTIHVQGTSAKFPIGDWHRMLAQNAGAAITCNVAVKNGSQWTRYKPFKIYVSEHAMQAYGLTYRKIAPGYEVYSSMGIYERRLDNFDERAIIANTQSPGMCVNCHTPNATRPQEFVFHVRGNHGATVVGRGDTLELLQAINDSIKGAMVYPYWHPSGRYCAFSTNQTRQGFHVKREKLVEVFDLSSDVFVYDVERQELLMDSALSTAPNSENIPSFSPDGRTLYYTSAQQREYPKDFRRQRYNLLAVGFDADSGKYVGRPDTLFNADAIEKSVTWPRPSYDGRYIMFTLADYGYFSIWHKESDLWLLDLRTRQARPLAEANSDDADSYHNWSADSRWFVFTSRRYNGQYSFLYIASVGEDGRATKPFMLPQEEPLDYYESTFYSFNTPDFTSEPVRFDSRRVAGLIESDIRTATVVRSE